jgi:hypothetical protein
MNRMAMCNWKNLVGLVVDEGAVRKMGLCFITCPPNLGFPKHRVHSKRAMVDHVVSLNRILNTATDIETS